MKPRDIVINLPENVQITGFYARCPRCDEQLTLRGDTASCDRCADEPEPGQPPSRRDLIGIAEQLERSATGAREAIARFTPDPRHPFHIRGLRQAERDERVAAWLRVQASE